MEHLSAASWCLSTRTERRCRFLWPVRFALAIGVVLAALSILEAQCDPTGLTKELEIPRLGRADGLAWDETLKSIWLLESTAVMRRYDARWTLLEGPITIPRPTGRDGEALALRGHDSEGTLLAYLMEWDSSPLTPPEVVEFRIDLGVAQVERRIVLTNLYAPTVGLAYHAGRYYVSYLRPSEGGIVELDPATGIWREILPGSALAVHLGSSGQIGSLDSTPEGCLWAWGRRDKRTLLVIALSPTPVIVSIWAHGVSGDQEALAVSRERVYVTGKDYPFRSWLFPVPVTDSVAPAIPVGLAATAGDGQVALDWSDNLEPDLAGYHVYRAPTTGGPYSRLSVTSVPGSLYVDSPLTNGATYFYVVTAIDHSGNESQFSSQVSATPQAPIPPAPPGGVVELFPLRLVWDAPTTRSDGSALTNCVLDYLVYGQLGTGTPVVLGTTDCDAWRVSVQAGTWTFYVTARCNGQLESAPSLAVSITVP